MANYFTWVSFALSPSPDDALFLQEVLEAIATSNGWTEPPPWSDRSNRFKSTFPKGAESEYENLHYKFEDPNWCDPGVQIETEDNTLVISGSEVDINNLAILIQLTCPSVLPFGFTWATTCDRMRTNAFFGGACAIFADKIEWANMSTQLEAMLRQ